MYGQSTTDADHSDRHAYDVTWQEAWNTAITNPDVYNYKTLAAADNASQQRAFLWIALAGLVAVIIRLGLAVLLGDGNLILGNSEYNISDDGVLVWIIYPAFIFIVLPLSFGFMTFFMWVIARNGFAREGEYADFVFVKCTAPSVVLCLRTASRKGHDFIGRHPNLI